MCGIVGMAGKITSSLEKVFEQMLIMDVLRGKHSTGVVSVDQKGEVIVAKKAMNALDFTETKFFEDVMRPMHSVLIGHNRYATIGKVNNINAHPFDFPNVVGVHNGTLTSRKDLFEQDLYDTDSESLYSHVNKYGIKSALKACEGAYALVFYDKNKDTINFIRNDKRTLFMTRCEKEEVIVWASEPWIIEGALGRNNIPYGEIVSIKEDTLLSFGVSGGSLTKPTTREIKSRQPVVVHNSRNYYSGNVTALPTNPLKGAKDRLMEIVGKASQPNSVEHFILKDRVSHNDKIRLYFTKDVDALNLNIGDCIYGDLTDYVATDGFVSVRVGSISKLAFIPDNSSGKEGERLEEHNESQTKFKDEKGKYILKADWIQAYGMCSWCTVDIDPEKDTYKLTSGGDVFCAHCAENEEVKLYTSFH